MNDERRWGYHSGQSGPEQPNDEYEAYPDSSDDQERAVDPASLTEPAGANETASFSGWTPPGEPAESQAPKPAKPQRFQGFADKAGSLLDRTSHVLAPHEDGADEALPENIARTPIMWGAFFVFLIFGIFMFWASLAPIDSAAIAKGEVTLDFNKKTIDHLEGGIVEKILVREGQIVEKGDPLIVLDDTAVKARRDLYYGQYIAARATEARLIAERDNLARVSFPEELLAKAKEDAKVASNIDAQRRLFKSRKESLQGKVEVLQQQIKQNQEEINGLRKQISSANQQLRLLGNEISDVQYLLRSGNAPKTRLLALQRRKAEIEGQRGERQALIARAEQRINEAKIEMYNLKTSFLNEVVQELKDTQVQISDLEEQLRAAEDVMRRVVIRAPITGQVTGLTVFTVGGVIAPGEPIMDIVPKDDKLVVEARIKPEDIDVVQVGLRARVRLLAYKVRSVPPVEGEVVTVSADRFQNEQTGEAYFLARIEIDDAQLDKLEGVELSPGMPAEVLVVTGARSLMAYLFSPITDSFNRAFREE